MLSFRKKELNRNGGAAGIHWGYPFPSHDAMFAWMSAPEIVFPLLSWTEKSESVMYGPCHGIWLKPPVPPGVERRR
jgi:hypothetical protein